MKKICLFVFLFLPLGYLFSQVSFDPTLDGDGKAYNNFFGYDNSLHDSCFQPDGKILAVGSIDDYANSFEEDFLTTRFLPNGALDLDFGIGGSIRTPNGIRSTARCLALQNDGKIVVAGTTELTSVIHEMMVMRYNPDGTPDDSFGISGKVVLTKESSWEIPDVAVIQPDGKISIAGYCTTNGMKQFFARLHPDGSLDTNFGVGGYVVLSDGLLGQIYDVEVAADGKILAGGTLDNKLLIRKLNANGTTDFTFGTSGKTTTVVAYMDRINYIVTMEDNSIIAVGQSKMNSSSLKTSGLIAKYTANGTLDTGFGTTGVVVQDFGTGINTYAGGVAIDSENRILVGFGRRYEQQMIALGCYSSTNGALIQGFGNNGLFIDTLSSGTVVILNLKLDSNQKIVLAGSGHENGGDESFFLARLEYNVLKNEVFNDENATVAFYPNPITKNSGLALNLKEDSSLVFDFFDESGRLLSSFSKQCQKGQSFEYFSFLESLSKGIYFLQLKEHNQTIQTIKLVK